MRWMAALFVTMMVLPTAAYAQADEIQVYDGGLAEPGVFNLTLHNNWIAKGISTPAFPGAVAADKSFNGVTEWAYGVSPWFEAGLYLPLYTHDKNLGFGIDGFKLRALAATPERLASWPIDRGEGLDFKFTLTCTMKPTVPRPWYLPAATEKR